MNNPESFAPTEPASDGYLYRFGPFLLDPRKRTLCGADSPVALTAKAFDVLLFLVRNPNRLVTKEELMRAVWGDTFVEEGNLTQYISHLRKALGDTSEDKRLIVTIARKGYQFTADVMVAEATETATPSVAHIRIAERSLTHAKPGRESPVHEAVPQMPGRLTKAVVAGVSAVLLLVGGFASWRQFGDVTPSTSKIMLAVLPFKNLTGDPSKEYLADGLTEETISQLSRLSPERLGVIARTSVMAYKHKTARLDEIGRELSVLYVLENSLQGSGARMRITSQLIRVKDQSHLWSHDYDYRPQDALAAQEQAARAVAREIQLRLTAQQEATLARSLSVNSDAFDAYLQGYYFFQRNTDKDTDMAARYYERATQLDPSYALAWAALSRTRHWQSIRGLVPREEGQRLAREAVQRALTLNPDLAAAHCEVVRQKLFVDFDLSGADASAQRAIALEPGFPATVRLAAVTAGYLGRLDEALRLNRRAVDLDPLNAESFASLAQTEYFIGQPDQAVANAKKALELSPDVWPGHILLIKIYLMLGRPEDALAEIELVRYDAERVFLKAIAYHAIGRAKESEAALRELIAKHHSSSAYLIATVHAVANRPDQAFEWLDRAYVQREGNIISTKIDPLLKSLRPDPRFAAFLNKTHLGN